MASNQQFASGLIQGGRSSIDTRNTYTESYYLTDCGGYEAFRRSKGKKLDDARLQSMALLASLNSPVTILDAGCGRGELAYYFASTGYNVTAIDYSPNAIALAEKCFEGEKEKYERVTFLCENICTFRLPDRFDAITASDVIEHLSAAEVDLFYSSCAQHLTSKGQLIIHTFPNIWYYKYDYPRRRKLSCQAGQPLPEQPRSQYELLMHINEQSPRILRKQLRKYFPYVALWFGSEENPGGSLTRHFNIRDLSAAKSLYAIASFSPININDLKEWLSSEIVEPLPANTIQIEALLPSGEIYISSTFEINVALSNHSESHLKSLQPYPVCLAYHWLSQSGEVIVWDGMRTKLLPPLAKGRKVIYSLNAKAPENVGNYVLRVTLVQEGVRWFDASPTNCFTDISVSITNAALLPEKKGLQIESLRANSFLKSEDHYRTSQDIKEWICDEQAWPTADSYDIKTLNPCTVLAAREASLKDQVPEWFWKGEEGASIVSIGTGKGYFERKYWHKFDGVYVVDPSESTHKSFEVSPLFNLAGSYRSLFDLPVHFDAPPKYGWMGASSHYAFGEFYGWSFMQKLAMMVSDTLIIDGGVFDASSQQGEFLLRKWHEEEILGNEPFELHRASQFSYEAFLSATENIWDILFEKPTPWITDGRRNLVLKRKLPPSIQRSELGNLHLLYDRQNKPRDNWKIYHTSDGYYKETPHIGSLLIYDTVSKAMGWPEMILYSVYDGDQYAGFIAKDYGDQPPDRPEVSERMFIKVLNWSLPLGLLPADVDRSNIRIFHEQPVWIDIMLLGLKEYHAFLAAWSATCTYKSYSDLPYHAPSYFQHRK